MAVPPDPAPERLPDLPRFAQVVAHEIRNPLSAVKIALQTLERHAGLGEKDGLRLAIALREVGTIEQVLTEILEWARPAEPRPEPVTAAEVVEAAANFVRPLFEERRLRLAREGEEGRLLRADPARLARALAELLENAAQASPEEARVLVRVRSEGGRTAFEVVDSGGGLAEEDLPRAFDPFFSRRAKGIGLGLCRARETARRQGGEVTLANSPGGATATLTLPESG